MSLSRITPWVIGITIFAGLTWFVAWSATAPAQTSVIGGTGPKVTADEWIKGTLTNDAIQIVEYSDFQCPACAAYNQTLKKIAAEFGNKIVIVYRHFPLPKHTNAIIAGQAAEAAGAQEKFWEMHDLLFENQATWGEASEEEATALFESYAAALTLNMIQYKIDFGAEKTKQKILASYEQGKKIGIQWTPSIFIDGELIMKNPSSVTAFSQIIADAIAKKTN